MKKNSFILLLALIDLGNNLNAQDAEFVWAKQLGGTGSDYSYSTAFDIDGNVYTTGSFSGTADFDPGIGVYNLTSQWVDIFISKLDPSGNFVWAKQIGGIYQDNAYSIAIDVNGNVYTTGKFIGTVDFDPGTGTYNLTSFGSEDIFISKLDASGNFVWAKQIGGTGGYLTNSGKSIIIDGYGNVYTTGSFSGTADFNPGAGTFNMTSFSNADIFISKLDASGNFVWAKHIGGSVFTENQGNSIVIDADGNVCTTGTFEGIADFDPGTGVYNLDSFGDADLEDIFVSKLNASGNFLWAKQLGGTDVEIGNSIALDEEGNIYTTGLFYGTADFDPGTGTYNLTNLGQSDIYVSKLDASGNFVWAKQFGGTNAEEGTSIAINTDGEACITGSFFGTVDFNPNSGTFNLTSFGESDIFVVKLNQGDDDISLSGNLSFGEVQIGQSPQLTFTIHNQGNDNLVVSSITYPNSVFTGDWSGTIPPSDSQDVTVTFSPTEETTYSGEVTVNSNASSGENTIDISGTGSLTPASQLILNTRILYNPLFPNPINLWSGNTNDNPPNIKICADGSSATSITFINNTGINSENIKFWVADDPYGDSTALYGYFINYEVSGNTITAEYAHPKYVPSNYKPYRPDNIKVVDYTNPDSPIFEIPIQIYRAPLLFVHGLDGDNTTFEAMDAILNNHGYYNHDLRKIINYHSTSYEAFSSNVDEIKYGINDLFNQLRLFNYSAGKVDIISHSMGGILSRLYLQSNYGYNYRGDVNKLITINTPHSGSQFANWVVLNPIFIEVCGLPIINNFLCSEAIIDLQTYSFAIDHELNSPEYLSQGHVPSHTISTYINYSDVDLCLEPFIGGYFSYLVMLASPVIFNNYQMDGVVRVDSQKGGLSGTQTSSTSDQCHLGAAANYDIILESEQLLCANPNDGQFSLNGFDPVNMKAVIPIQQNIVARQVSYRNNLAEPFIEITDPKSGSTFISNQTISISVNTDNSIDRLAFLIGNTNLGISYIDTTIVSQTNTFNYTIPSDAIGQMEIDLIGFDSTNIVAWDSVTFTVITNATLDSIRLIPQHILIPVDNTNHFQILGYYSDNVVRDLTLLHGIRLTTENNNIAKVKSQGIIEGVSEDSTFLMVSFQGIVDTIPIYVFEDNSFSLPLFSSNTDVICGEDGEVIFFNQSSGKPQSIQWNFPGGNPPASSDSIVSVHYTLSGTYDVSLIATYLTKTDTLALNGYITVSAPPYSTLNLVDDTIYCSVTNGEAYQWYYNNDPIFSSDIYSVHPESEGEYYVDVMNGDGCIARSDSLYYVPNGVTYFPKEMNILLYPNPTNGTFTLEIGKVNTGEITVINLLGSTIYKAGISSSKTNIDLIHCQRGIYFVKLALDGKVYTEKLIIQ